MAGRCRTPARRFRSLGAGSWGPGPDLMATLASIQVAAGPMDRILEAAPCGQPPRGALIPVSVHPRAREAQPSSGRRGRTPPCGGSPRGVQRCSLGPPTVPPHGSDAAPPARRASGIARARRAAPGGPESRQGFSPWERTGGKVNEMTASGVLSLRRAHELPELSQASSQHWQAPVASWFLCLIRQSRVGRAGPRGWGSGSAPVPP